MVSRRSAPAASFRFAYPLAALLPLTVAALLAWLWPPVVLSFGPATDIPLHTIRVTTIPALEAAFVRHAYTWPPESNVPRLEVAALPEGLQALPSEERKALFFRTLLPLVLAENARLLIRREFIITQFAQAEIDFSTPEGKLLQQLAARYEISGDLNQPQERMRLLRRVDEVPPSLILAQAAHESGWGTSRFAQQANNLFGIWTWDPEAGLPPHNRAADASHYVRIYPDLRSSVRSYLYNLNIGHSYLELRRQRASMRANGEPLDSLQLVENLHGYSIRGTAYVDDIRTLITGNQLQQLDASQLEPLNY